MESRMLNRPLPTIPDIGPCREEIATKEQQPEPWTRHIRRVLALVELRRPRKWLIIMRWSLKLVGRLERNTGEARRGVYERVRTALRDQLNSLDPPLSGHQIIAECV